MVDKKNPDDESLVAAWQAGQNREEVFECLFMRYRLPIATFFKKRGFSDEECRDLTQQAFVRVYQGMPRFQHTASFKTWLFQIARNLWKNTLRDRQAGKRAAQEVSLNGMVRATGEAPAEIEHSLTTNNRPLGPLSKILGAERHQRLLAVIAELPAEQQRLMLYRIDQELKYREIADLMKMPVGTVKSQLAKARNFIREKLGEVYEDVDL